MITLSSDFKSPYPAAMKGVICQWTETRLVDVAHDLPRQDLRTSAFWLREMLPYFPPAVHLAVIDPGVGTDRAAIVVRAGEHALVGPDNGVLVPAARRLADGEIEVFQIETRAESTEGTDRTAWPPRLASSTFHGRDVFAPAAARVHEIGVDALETDEGLRATDSYESLTFPDPAISAGGATGVILAVDGFGNAITNVPGEHVADLFGTEIAVDGESVPLRHSYAAVEPGQRLVTVGSHGNVELAVNQGRGSDAFGVESEDSVRLSW
jgi:S-adenosylmethionine hydrolase